MPDTTGTGKAGTITIEEFEELTAWSERYGTRLLAQKVGKICLKEATPYVREYSNSAVGLAWSGLAAKINTAVGQHTTDISREAFHFLTDLVEQYGAEVVMQKLGKIAGRMNNATDAALFKELFPKTTVLRAS
jgi:hypothetical protein